MIIVSDTSPVSNLILIGRLDLLKSLYSAVIVPPAVDREIIALTELGYDLSSYQKADWIKVIAPKHSDKVIELDLSLDRGEAEAISLALDTECDLLLIDERAGTRAARREGLKTIGLLGVLVQAKQKALINDVSSILTVLKFQAGFWFDEELEIAILTEVRETKI